MCLTAFLFTAIWSVTVKASLTTAAAIVFLSLMPSSAKAQESLSNTYHVEVLVHYIGYVSPSIAADYQGSSTWRTGYSTTDQGQAEFILDLFEVALETGGLELMLGYNPQSWLIVDVRLRTEYPLRSSLMMIEDRPTLTQQYLRRTYSAPTVQR